MTPWCFRLLKRHFSHLCTFSSKSLGYIPHSRIYFSTHQTNEEEGLAVPQFQMQKIFLHWIIRIKNKYMKKNPYSKKLRWSAACSPPKRKTSDSLNEIIDQLPTTTWEVYMKTFSSHVIIWIFLWGEHILHHIFNTKSEILFSGSTRNLTPCWKYYQLMRGEIRG